MQYLTQDCSLLGGFLMTAVGVIYLAFEKQLLAKSGLRGDSTAPANNVLSRSLIGVQVRKAPTRRDGF
jgi:phosphatidylinositol glycan class N